MATADSHPLHMATAHSHPLPVATPLLESSRRDGDKKLTAADAGHAVGDADARPSKSETTKPCSNPGRASMARSWLSSGSSTGFVFGPAMPADPRCQLALDASWRSMPAGARALYTGVHMNVYTDVYVFADTPVSTHAYAKRACRHSSCPHAHRIRHGLSGMPAAHFCL